jgi:integrase
MGCWLVKGKGWRYRFEFKGKDHTGQWFKTKAEAQAARAEHRKQLKSPPQTESEPPELDFASLILDYIEEAQRKFRPKPWKYKRFVYQSFMDFAGNLPLSQITEHLVGKYLLTRPSNYNYNFHRKDLSALFRWGLDRGLMQSNPCAKIEPLAVEQSDLIHITDEEWSRFLLAAGRDRPFFLTVFYTLGRVGEIFRLKWGDLDWEREEIRLWTRKRKGGQMEEDWLPMPAELRDTLMGLKRKPDRHPEYVFINPKTSKPFTQRRRLVQGVCKRAGVRIFGFHAIRHMGADWLMNNGEDLRTISRYLRHKSLATTEKYLRRRPDEGLKRAAKTLQNKKPLTIPLMERGYESSQNEITFTSHGGDEGT